MSGISLSFSEWPYPADGKQRPVLKWGECGLLAHAIGSHLTIYTEISNSLRPLLMFTPSKSRDITALEWVSPSSTTDQALPVLLIGFNQGSVLILDVREKSFISRINRRGESISQIKWCPNSKTDFFIGTKEGSIIRLGISRDAKLDVSVHWSTNIQMPVDFLDVDEVTSNSMVAASEDGRVCILKKIAPEMELKVLPPKAIDVRNSKITFCKFHPYHPRFLLIGVPNDVLTYHIQSKKIGQYLQMGDVRSIIPISGPTPMILATTLRKATLWRAKKDSWEDIHSVDLTPIGSSPVDNLFVTHFRESLAIYTSDQWLSLLEVHRSKVFVTMRTRLFNAKPLGWAVYGGSIAFGLGSGDVMLTRPTPKAIIGRDTSRRVKQHKTEKKKHEKQHKPSQKPANKTKDTAGYSVFFDDDEDDDFLLPSMVAPLEKSDGPRTLYVKEDEPIPKIAPQSSFTASRWNPFLDGSVNEEQKTLSPKEIFAMPPPPPSSSILGPPPPPSSSILGPPPPPSSILGPPPPPSSSPMRPESPSYTPAKLTGHRQPKKRQYSALLTPDSSKMAITKTAVSDEFPRFDRPRRKSLSDIDTGNEFLRRVFQQKQGSKEDGGNAKEETEIKCNGCETQINRCLHLADRPIADVIWVGHDRLLGWTSVDLTATSTSMITMFDFRKRKKINLITPGLQEMKLQITKAFFDLPHYVSAFIFDGKIVKFYKMTSSPGEIGSLTFQNPVFGTFAGENKAFFLDTEYIGYFVNGINSKNPSIRIENQMKMQLPTSRITAMIYWKSHVFIGTDIGLVYRLSLESLKRSNVTQMQSGIKALTVAGKDSLLILDQQGDAKVIASGVDMPLKGKFKRIMPIAPGTFLARQPKTGALTVVPIAGKPEVIFPPCMRLTYSLLDPKEMSEKIYSLRIGTVQDALSVCRRFGFPLLDKSIRRVVYPFLSKAHISHLKEILLRQRGLVIPLMRLATELGDTEAIEKIADRIDVSEKSAVATIQKLALVGIPKDSPIIETAINQLISIGANSTALDVMLITDQWENGLDFLLQGNYLEEAYIITQTRAATAVSAAELVQSVVDLVVSKKLFHYGASLLAQMSLVEPLINLFDEQGENEQCFVLASVPFTTKAR